MTAKTRKHCYCPFCEKELQLSCIGRPAFCEPCQVELVSCLACGQLMNISIELCPKCGVKANGNGHNNKKK